MLSDLAGGAAAARRVHRRTGEQRPETASSLKNRWEELKVEEVFIIPAGAIRFAAGGKRENNDHHNRRTRQMQRFFVFFEVTISRGRQLQVEMSSSAARRRKKNQLLERISQDSTGSPQGFQLSTLYWNRFMSHLQPRHKRWRHEKADSCFF